LDIWLHLAATRIFPIVILLLRVVCRQEVVAGQMVVVARSHRDRDALADCLTVMVVVARSRLVLGVLAD
jgi:hypothetical protein